LSIILLGLVNYHFNFNCKILADQIRKYNKQTAKARSWDDIEEDFIKWFNGVYKENIAKLIQSIKSSGLTDRLYAYTSMDKLVVSIYDPIEWNREALHITFDSGSQILCKTFPRRRIY